MAFDPVSAAFEVGGKLIDRLWPDPAQRDAAKIKLLDMKQTGELAQLTADTELAKAQLAVNQEEAKSPNMLIAGWRPFIGWTCGFAFAYSYILLPFLLFAVYTFGSAETITQLAKLPRLELAEMLPVLFGMLGLGGLRTAEKVKGVESNR